MAACIGVSIIIVLQCEEARVMFQHLGLMTTIAEITANGGVFPAHQLCSNNEGGRVWGDHFRAS